ncbi:GroES-like protein [Periconia macrospinosa]|uniref:GroES-like protein n=1 Tax=Periconia macrospinosa TaxID=97972 RepID=A0A2V1DWD5_9PLEO|nr:GroES-like protein [Periconia macrospinosa]
MSTMKAWQFKTANGGIEKNLFLSDAGVDIPKITDNEVLVEVYAAALNPVDYKLPEMGLLAKVAVPSPCTPGRDFCGKVVKRGSKANSFEVGEMVFGAYTATSGHGSLAQYVSVTEETIASMPEGLQVDDAAGIGVAGLTAYQSIKPYVKDGDKVFINGGSGGTGVFCIQIAKLLGCHVTVTCSSANADLCKSIGADEIIDYKLVDIVNALQEKGQVFKLAVDNVGTPANLYKVSHNFLAPDGQFIQVGASSGIGTFAHVASNMFVPSFLGGGKRKYRLEITKFNTEELAEIGKWMKEGKIQAVTDSTFDFNDVPKAFEKLRTGRTKGKIVVHVKKN